MVRLRSAGLSRTYRRNLREAGFWLLALVQRLGKTLTRDDPPHVVDRWLERAVDAAYQDGEKLYLVNLGIVAIQRTFKLSAPLLRGAWAAVRGWKSLLPSRSRVPITKYRLECLILRALSRGWSEEGIIRRRWWSAALAWWLGFVCLLRPGELLNLRMGDISLPEGDESVFHVLGAVVIIRRPKTRRIWREQFVVCNDHALIRWLVWWTRDLTVSSSLFNLSRHMLVNHFKLLTDELGLAPCNYTLSSLRAGGATDHFQRNRNLGELQYLGRWKQPSTLQYYLHEAYAIHVTRQQFRGHSERLEMLHAQVHLLERPPPRSLSVLVRR